MLVLLFLLSFHLVTRSQPGYKVSGFVDPFIGTGGHGHTYPGAVVPSGMVQLSPDQIANSWDYCSAYHYPDTKVIGFSHTHLSGTGGGDMWDVRLQPTQTDRILMDTLWNGRNTGHQFAAEMLRESEKAEPGYYTVTFAGTKITTELTTTCRAGFSRFLYPEGKQNLALDLGYTGGDPEMSRITIVSDTLVTGYNFTRGWAKKQKIFFAIRFSKPILSASFSRRGKPLVSDSAEVNGAYLLALFRFAGNAGPLMAKVGISSVSIGNALQNLDTEISNWDFECVKANAAEAWEKALSVIKIETKNEARKKIFYTAMYHNLVAPNVFSDINGQYRAENDSVYTSANAPYYTVFSLWDTYRATHPLYTLIAPQKVTEFVQTMLAHYREHGTLPVWTLWGEETWGMSGTHSIPVILDAWQKGIGGFDLQEAYLAARQSVMSNTRNYDDYRMLGYVPAGKNPESGSCSMEYYYDDWCVAQMALMLGKTDDYNYFLARSKNYTLTFNPAAGTIQPRNSDGTWKFPFNAIGMGSKYGFSEGDAWQYTFSVQHDIPGLVSMLGGRENFEKKLDYLFTLQNTVNPGEVLDVTGIIGLYAHGNEPCHHIPYLYNVAGKAWKTQKLVKEIRDSLYLAQRDGLCGNDDCGQISAWYVFSALGFYPLNPADGRYYIGTPAFDKAIIHLPSGNTFTVFANNPGDKNFFVNSVKLNGHKLNQPYITHAQLMKGGTLEFEMSPLPNRKNWSGFGQ